MENETYHILWVSSTPSIPAAVQQIARQAAAHVRVTTAAQYEAAIQAAALDAPDAILVLADFDSLAVLEFVHHARLLDGQAPIVILCKEYDAALDYKSRKLGATDCVAMAEVDAQFLGGLMQKRQMAPRKVQRSLRMGKSILQIPVWFKQGKNLIRERKLG